MQKFFITAIDTDAGKTFVSTLLTYLLEADYWKPIQAGKPTDSNFVRNHLHNDYHNVFEEAYLLDAPMSPHAAAERMDMEISIKGIAVPQSDRRMIVEGAGGLLAPLNDKDTIVDLIEELNLPTILVSNYYLGSINHTLLSINELKRRGVNLIGIVFNGVANKDTRDIILKKSGIPCLLDIPKFPEHMRDIKTISDELMKDENFAKGIEFLKGQEY